MPKQQIRRRKIRFPAPDGIFGADCHLPKQLLAREGVLHLIQQRGKYAQSVLNGCGCGHIYAGAPQQIDGVLGTAAG